MNGRDFAQALATVRALSTAAASTDGFAAAGVRVLAKLVASELTTLSVCDLRSGRRSVVSDPPRAIGSHDVDCFNRFFFQHPLVRYHAAHVDGGSRKISDSLPPRVFRETSLYNAYYRRIGIDHVIAVPLFVDASLLVSFVFNRTRRDFSERDRAVLDAVRQPLAGFYRAALTLERTRRSLARMRARIEHEGGSAIEVSAGGRLGAAPRRAALTAREEQVLRWVAAGKSNAQIAAIVGASPGTVQKHLEHVYVKLGWNRGRQRRCAISVSSASL